MPRQGKVNIGVKIRLARKCIKGELSCSEAARQAGVDYETLKAWIRLYETEGVEACDGVQMVRGDYGA